MSNLLYSIVIPTCGRPVALDILLSKLMPQIDKRGEVIVTDDCFDTAAASALVGQFEDLHVLQGPGRGPASNRNHGASFARGDWLIFLDDDVVPDALLIQSYLEKMRAKDMPDVIEGRTYSDADFDFSRFEAPINEAGGKLWSCNFAIQRELFIAIGGFSEVFHTYGGEDMDLHDRLRSLHIQIEFVREAAVYHKSRPIPSVYRVVLRWQSGLIRRLLNGTGAITIMFTLPRHILAFGVGESRKFIRVSDKIRWILRSLAVSILVACFLPWWILRNRKAVSREALRRKSL